MIYLAAPYSHPNRAIRYKRVISTGRAVAYGLLRSEFYFSPILHGFHAEASFGQEVDWSRWMMHGINMLDACGQMAVLELPGWERSKGTQMEIDHCKLKDYPVKSIPLSTCRMFLPKGLIEQLLIQEEYDAQNTNQ